MNCKSRLQSGLTLVELLLVISIFVTITGFLVLAFNNYAKFQQYNQAVNDIGFVLNQARTDAKSAVLDDSHGVKINTNSIITFVGDTYSMSDPSNETIAYNLVSLTPNLSGGTDEIIFSKLTGLPSATGTVVVAGVSFSSSSTISINEAGVIQ